MNLGPSKHSLQSTVDEDPSTQNRPREESTPLSNRAMREESYLGDDSASIFQESSRPQRKKSLLDMVRDFNTNRVRPTRKRMPPSPTGAEKRQRFAPPRKIKK